MPQYEFRIADHLDNTRVLFSDKNGDGLISESEISDISSYYSFGLRHRGINAKINNTHDYLFNNKERVGDFGLRWDFYDFRVLDSEIGRFIQVDPIAEQFPHVSPMNYAENEPIAHIDLHGLQKYKPKGQSIDKPSDLLSTKMLNNLKEGAKTVAVEMGRIISDAVNTVGEIIENAEGTEAPSQVEGGLAGSAENGQGNETRVNESAENIELDEFTSGAIPKPPVGKTGAIVRAGAKVGKEVAEQLQAGKKETRPTVRPVDSICNTCNRAPHGLPYQRLDKNNNPIDTINPNN